MHTIQGLNWPSGFILQCLSNKTLPVVQGQFFIVKLEPLNPSLQVEPNHLYNEALNLAAHL